MCGGIFLIASRGTDRLGGKEEKGPAEPLGMEVGKMKTSGEDVDEEIRGEIDGGSAIEGEVGREHMKAWRVKERKRWIEGRRGVWKTWQE